MSAHTYIERRFSETEVSYDPFTHLLIEGVLPPELYAEMARSLPHGKIWRLSQMLGGEQPMFAIRPDNQISPLLWHYAKLWKQRFKPYVDLVDALIVEKMRPAITAYLERLKTEGFLKKSPVICAGQSVFCRRSHDWGIRPHVHDITQLTQAMIYFPVEGSSTDQGTLLFSASMEAERADFFRTLIYPYSNIRGLTSIPFKENTLIAFVNTPNAVHGTSNAPGPHRRYIFTGMAMNRDAFNEVAQGRVHTSVFRIGDQKNSSTMTIPGAPADPAAAD